MGRVLVAQSHRKLGLGKELVSRGIEYIETIYPEMRIFAQTQARSLGEFLSILWF
ncbi:hypothetical protein [Psychrobacillus sp. NPDC096389]|uniref:hypothetical protein n=1 Tax=Psychrobacillus sp. NPDC096389 TaxID=3364490 RepID=UPI00381527D2